MSLGRYCMQCSYDLHGLQGNLCPECGRGFDLNDERTFSRTPDRRRRVPGIEYVLLALAIGGLMVMAIFATGYQPGEESVYGSRRMPSWVIWVAHSLELISFIGSLLSRAYLKVTDRRVLLASLIVSGLIVCGYWGLVLFVLILWSL
jgi:hypothetical protein